MAEQRTEEVPTGEPMATPEPPDPHQGHGLPGTEEERRRMNGDKDDDTSERPSRRSSKS